MPIEISSLGKELEKIELAGVAGAAPLSGDGSVAGEHSSKELVKRSNNNGIRK